MNEKLSWNIKKKKRYLDHISTEQQFMWRISYVISLQFSKKKKKYK